ncbi:MAG TPA: hypothetical protein VM348_12995 [Brevundimonas sp.]|nr:hypothetical protein [Brevundimonas sp.]
MNEAALQALVSPWEASVARDDWYRNTDWNSAIEGAFNAKLARAREKSQYLRIQASMLARNHPLVALSLIDRYFALDDLWDAATAYLCQFYAYTELGDQKQALTALQNALKREQDFPNLRAGADLVFARMVATQGLDTLFDQALQALDARAQRGAGLLFPADRYSWNGSRALILEAKGSQSKAIEAAKEAIRNADVQHSGLRNHPKVGLVEDTESAFHARLVRLAGAASLH